MLQKRNTKFIFVRRSLSVGWFNSVCVCVCVCTWSSIWSRWLDLHWASHLHTMSTGHSSIRTYVCTYLTYRPTTPLLDMDKHCSCGHTQLTTVKAQKHFIHRPHTGTSVRTHTRHIYIHTYICTHPHTHPREGCLVVKLFHSPFGTLSLTKCYKSTPYSDRGRRQGSDATLHGRNWLE